MIWQLTGAICLVLSSASLVWWCYHFIREWTRSDWQQFETGVAYGIPVEQRVTVEHEVA